MNSTIKWTYLLMIYINFIIILLNFLGFIGNGLPKEIIALCCMIMLTSTLALDNNKLREEINKLKKVKT